MIEQVAIVCPYCGEQFETQVDCSAGDQTYYEDCAICCCPILFRSRVNEQSELLYVEALREDE